MKKRADIVLVEKKLAPTRSKARAMIMAGQISIDDNIIKKSGEMINLDSNIQVSNLNPEWVSRGAIKLIHAINFFEIKVKNCICLDIGASTGGFSEVLLKNEAKKIYSVDVGTNQFHEKLKKEKRIISLEKTNARYLSRRVIQDEIDLIVCDVSFISMKKVLKPCLSFLNTKSGIIIGLIKPQFEACRNEIKKGGIILDNKIHKRICNEFERWFIENCQMKIIGIIQSPIKGPKGNIEFLIAAKFNL